MSPNELLDRDKRQFPRTVSFIFTVKVYADRNNSTEMRLARLLFTISPKWIACVQTITKL